MARFLLKDLAHVGQCLPSLALVFLIASVTANADISDISSPNALASLFISSEIRMDLVILGFIAIFLFNLHKLLKCFFLSVIGLMEAKLIIFREA